MRRVKSERPTLRVSNFPFHSSLFLLPPPSHPDVAAQGKTIGDPREFQKRGRFPAKFSQKMTALTGKWGASV